MVFSRICISRPPGLDGAEEIWMVYDEFDVLWIYSDMLNCLIFEIVMMDHIEHYRMMDCHGMAVQVLLY